MTRTIRTLASLVLAAATFAPGTAAAGPMCGNYSEIVDVTGGVETHSFLTTSPGGSAEATVSITTSPSSGTVEAKIGGTWQTLSGSAGSVTAVRFDDGSGAVLHIDFGDCDADILDTDPLTPVRGPGVGRAHALSNGATTRYLAALRFPTR